jgi:hypothetical protein
VVSFYTILYSIRCSNIHISLLFFYPASKPVASASHSAVATPGAPNQSAANKIVPALAVGVASAMGAMFFF